MKLKRLIFVCFTGLWGELSNNRLVNKECYDGKRNGLQELQFPSAVQPLDTLLLLYGAEGLPKCSVPVEECINNTVRECSLKLCSVLRVTLSSKKCQLK